MVRALVLGRAMGARYVAMARQSCAVSPRGTPAVAAHRGAFARGSPVRRAGKEAEPQAAGRRARAKRAQQLRSSSTWRSRALRKGNHSPSRRTCVCRRRSFLFGWLLSFLLEQRQRKLAQHPIREAVDAVRALAATRPALVSSSRTAVADRGTLSHTCRRARRRSRRTSAAPENRRWTVGNSTPGRGTGVRTPRDAGKCPSASMLPGPPRRDSRLQELAHDHSRARSVLP